ncbi:DNA cytosine methyltransferase [Intrasporangium flavum]|uniref:DNA cytosine methyltransferase n=1 Tax=Intrasporangium flavum TaxID=1428657 RepID=UPI00096D011C|nr:DNA (cytosine-5-)-methyltransferase [Intrasporangium flavum]
MDKLTVIEICAGAGGQALGLEQAGFEHTVAIEIDSHAATTLRSNLGADRVREGDVADRHVWDPREFTGRVDLLAGGVPCPPFSTAGRQLGAQDERDLFAWAVETAGVVAPRALLLENVRGLSMPRFAAYRQHVLDRLRELGYVGDWRLLNASDYGVAQLRPRFVLVALRREDFAYFSWPEAAPTSKTVGSELQSMMSEGKWEHAAEWASMADGIAPTIVGGSKRHGGADLGPTRAKAAWRRLAVDGMGVADAPPKFGEPRPSVKPPRLTVEMVARLQGWDADDPAHRTWLENLSGRKTAKYRQIGNAFPPPVARAVGTQIALALSHSGAPRSQSEQIDPVHDDVYRVLREASGFITADAIITAVSNGLDAPTLERRMAHLSADFAIEVKTTAKGPAYKLGQFKAFTGQEDHHRFDYLTRYRSKVS